MDRRAANVKAPHDPDTANDFRVRRFTATATHAANALPGTWAGRFVKMTAVGGIVNFAFSKRSGAEIVYNQTATAAGESDKVGDYLGDGVSDHFQVPEAAPGETIYFVREASATCSVYIRLADDPRAGA